MICRALGYTAQAKELVGAWPANYIALAQQLSLYDDVAATGLTDRATAAQIVYNALTVPLRYIDADGVTQWLTNKDGSVVTMLGSLGGKQLYGGDGFVLTAARARTAAVDVTEYVGQFVTAYLNDDNEIIAVDVLSTTISGDIKNGEFAGDDDVTYYYGPSTTATGAAKFAGIDEENATSSTAIALPSLSFVNGEYVALYGPNLPVTDPATSVTMAVKLSGKTIKEIYSIITWRVDDQSTESNPFAVEDLDIEKAKITVNGTTAKFKTDKNGDIDVNQFDLIGATSLSKIKDGDIVELFQHADGTVARIAVGTKTVKGTVTKVNAGSSKYWIDGTKYAATGNGDNLPALGETGTAYLNYDGDIAEWVADDATAGNYAIYKGAANDSNVTGTSNASKVALFLKDGSDKEFKLNKNHTVDTANLVTPTNTKVPGQTGLIVKYSFNKDDELNTDIAPATGEQILSGYVNQNYTAFGGKEFASEVVVFTWDGSDWDTASIKDLMTKEDMTNFTATVVLNTANKIEAMAVSTAVVSTDDQYGFINSLSGRMNGNDKKWYAEGVINGEKLDTFTDQDYSVGGTIFGIDTAYDPKTVAKTNLYKISRDADGVITNVVAHTFSGTDQNIANATVTAIKGNAITLTTTAGVEYVVDISKDAVVYYWDKDDEEFVLSNISAIKKNKKVEVFSTKTELQNKGEYNIVVFWDAE